MKASIPAQTVDQPCHCHRDTSAAQPRADAVSRVESYYVRERRRARRLLDEIITRFQELKETLADPIEIGPRFRSLNWFGTEYSFTGNQAKIVEALYQAWN